jgi:anti-sigma regulatory factor (Ser/Thr protein kinase)
MYYDQEIVEKAVSNLLSNALKFTPAGGEVAVTVTGSAGGGAAISVRDTGIGIPPGDAGRIFDRFHQVDGTTTRSQEGTGIGLSLVRELVQIHGGTVEYKSGSGKGAEFVLTIPAGAERLAVAEVLPGDAGVEPDRAARGPDSQANASNPTQDSIHHDARMLPSFGLVAGQLRRRVKKQLVRPGGP